MANLPPSNSVFMPTSDIVAADSEYLQREIRRLQMEREAIRARLSTFIPLNSGPTEIHRVLSCVLLMILGNYDSGTPTTTTIQFWILPRMPHENDSDSGPEDGLLRTFDLPPQTASKEELLNALRNAQLEMGRLVVENRDLKAKLVVSESGTGRRRKPMLAELNPDGYLEVVVSLGKQFGYMEEPWVHPAVFADRPVEGAPPHESAEEIDELFKSPKLYQQFLTSCLYDHVLAQFHHLIDSAKYPAFSENFLKHLNAGRSSAANTLKSNMARILAECEIKDNAATLLYHPGEDTKGLPSSYPPIFYPGLKKDIKTRLLNPMLPTALRCMLFGAASIAKGSRPLTTTYGYIWKVTGLTIGSICFTLIVIIRVLSGKDTTFEEKGKISGIPYLTYFRTYKKLLMKTAATPGVRNILKFWSRIVFAGVEAAPRKQHAAFAAAMEAMTVDDIPEGPEPDFVDDTDDAPGDNATAAQATATDEERVESEVEAEIVNVSARGGRGRGAGRGRGRARGRGRGRGQDQVIDEDHPPSAPRRGRVPANRIIDSDETPPEPVQRLRRNRRN
ncbi:hypothetical protein B0H12DRAFT_1231025 [Mycena haematopus]|nr:hypothetical protein B0H12DRAFT_1231025 [Mycena haematopus]